MPDLYRLGWWSCSYVLTPIETPPSLATLRRFLLEVEGTETGWPVWLALDNRPSMAAHIEGGIIECWLRDVSSADFWRADPKGYMFLLRKFQEDTDFQSVPAGTCLDLILPIWRTGECLLHAGRLAEKVGATTVDLTMTWHGLAGRELRALTGNRMLSPGNICNDDEVLTVITAAASEISEILPELVKALVAPLYEHFDFFEPPSNIYVAEIHRMRTGIR
jgi:hypothetical protein